MVKIFLFRCRQRRAIFNQARILKQIPIVFIRIIVKSGNLRRWSGGEKIQSTWLSDTTKIRATKNILTKTMLFRFKILTRSLIWTVPISNYHRAYFLFLRTKSPFFFLYGRNFYWGVKMWYTEMDKNTMKR